MIRYELDNDLGISWGICGGKLDFSIVSTTYLDMVEVVGSSPIVRTKFPPNNSNTYEGNSEHCRAALISNKIIADHSDLLSCGGFVGDAVPIGLFSKLSDGIPKTLSQSKPNHKSSSGELREPGSVASRAHAIVVISRCTRKVPPFRNNVKAKIRGKSGINYSDHM